MTEDSLLGLQLDEYRLEALLGRGGMARVYRGLDTGLNRYVAVKVIDTPFRSDEEYVKRFQIEAQAIARLDHPHVVRLYRYGEVDGMLYMAMQFIEGVDLGYLLESYRLDGEHITFDDALRVVTEICQALDYVHAHGIIHRDVKPSNIMLTRDEGRVILTDFGLALRSEVGTRGEVFGSPHYIAPEQAVSSAKSVPQSDLYSLGVILYEMFTGILPFVAPEPLDVAIQHMSSPPPPPREVRPELSPEVEAVILKALEKKPEDRYQTGRALALALERALRRQADQPPPTNRSIPERVTIGFSANPLPALPPLPQAELPAKRAVDEEIASPAPRRNAQVPSAGGEPPATVQFLPHMVEPRAPAHDRAVPPVDESPRDGKKSSPWLLFGAAGLAGLCLITCLLVGALALILRPDDPDRVSGVAQSTPTRPRILTATEAPTGQPIAQPTPQPIPLEDYRLKFWRCGDEGCLLVENTGSDPFPLHDLVLEGDDAGLSGEEWGVDRLEPGQCVKVVKNEDWIRRMPDGADCAVVGHPLMREGKHRFWDDEFTVEFKGEETGDCGKKADWCEIRVPR